MLGRFQNGRFWRPILGNGPAATARVLAAVFGLLQLSLGARLLDTSEFSLATVAIAFAVVASTGLEPPILGYQRLGSHEQDGATKRDPSRVAAHALLLMMSVSVVAASIAAGLLTDSLAYYVATAMWTLSLVELRWVNVQALNWGLLRRFTGVVAANAVVRAGGFIAGAAAFGSATAALLAGGIGSLTVTALLAPRPRPRGLPALIIVRRVVALGLVMTLVSAANIFVSQGIYLVANRALSTATYAAFAAQASLSVAVFSVTAGFFAVVGFPRAKRLWDVGDESAARQIVLLYAWFTLTAGAIMSGVWLVAGGLVTDVVLTPKYSGNSVPAAMTIVACLSTTALVTGWILQLQFRQKLLALVSWLASGPFFLLVMVGAVQSEGTLLMAATGVGLVQVALLVVLGVGKSGYWLLGAAALLSSCGVMIALAA